MDSSFLNKAKQTERGVIDLGLGEFSNKNSSTREILEFSVERALNQGVLYTDGFGSEKLRKKIALYHNNIFSDITSYKNIGVTVGALHGLFLALSVLKPMLGEIILISPYFPPYLELFNNSGIKVKIISSNSDFSFPLDAVKANMTQSTSAILINYPNNPSGYSLSRREREQIIELIRDRDLWLIEDIVYHRFSEKNTRPIWCDQKEKVILINSFSKTFAMTGWRIGYLMCNDSLLSECMNFNNSITFSPPTLSQYAAEFVLLNEQKYFETQIELITQNSKIVEKELEGISEFENVIYRGGIYMFIRLNLEDRLLKKFFKTLSEEYNVIVIEGNEFGKEYRDYFRVSLSVSQEILIDGIKKIKSCLKCINNSNSS